MPFVRFETSGLLSKWGFWDGEILNEFFYDHGCTCGFDGTHSAQDRLLIAVVRQYVAPQLEQHVILKECGCTSHNPILAEFVDGVEVDPHHNGKNPELTPAFVDVSEDDILLVARRIGVYKGPITVEGEFVDVKIAKALTVQK